MAVSRGIGGLAIGIGITVLVLAIGAAVCGGISMNKLTNDGASTSIGVWAAYFIIPGILSIVAGGTRNKILFGFTIGLHIIGLLLAFAGIAFGAAFWIVLNTCFDLQQIFGEDTCICQPYSNSVHYYYSSCSDLKVVRNLTGAATILYCLLLIICFIGSIFGCVGTCENTRDRTVVVMQPPYTIPVNSRHWSDAYQYDQPAYPGAMHRYYKESYYPPDAAHGYYNTQMNYPRFAGHMPHIREVDQGGYEMSGRRFGDQRVPRLKYIEY